MRRLFISISCIILLSGCAGLRTQQASEWDGNYVELASVGIYAVNINNELVVSSLTKNFPAELAGVKRGDVIVTVDGKIIATWKEFVFLMDNKQHGDHVLLVINRNGQIMNFDVEPKVINALPTGLKMRKLLVENKKVSIAVIVSDVKNSYQNVPGDWADSIRNKLQSECESGMLAGFGEYENFSIVDRNRLKQIMDEFRFNQLGLVSDKLRVKIGEMTGATHILDITFSRFQGKYSPDDVLNDRLIEIESGTVLAVDQLRK